MGNIIISSSAAVLSSASQKNDVGRRDFLKKAATMLLVAGALYLTSGSGVLKTVLAQLPDKNVASEVTSQPNANASEAYYNGPVELHIAQQTLMYIC